MRNTYKNWLARIDYINKEYEFPDKLIEYRDILGRLHHDEIPAYQSPVRIIHYREGRRHGIDVSKFGSINYYYENIIVPARFLLVPEEITINEVLAHPNVEVRYVGIKIIGFDKVKSAANMIDETSNMCLFKINIGLSDNLTILQVTNSTPELDGSSYKKYYLNVPPNMESCRQAVAWTFYKDENSYHPVQET